MALDPQIAAMLAAANGQWPAVESVPLSTLRQLASESIKLLPPMSISLAGVRDQTIPGPAGSLAIRVYTPIGTGPFPLVVFFHGGGWVLGDLDSQDMIARGLASGADAVIVSVDYRLAPEHPFPAAADDSFAALRWVAENATSLNGDASRLAVAGDSAGAILSAGAAIQARDLDGPPLAAQVLFYGAGRYPMEDSESSRAYASGPLLSLADIDFYWRQYLCNANVEQSDPRVSPALATTHVGLPPAFVASAECDPIRDSCEAYGRILADSGVKVVSRRYKGMPHGFVSWVSFVPTARQALDEACTFLKTHWKTT